MVSPGAGRLPAQGTSEVAKQVEEQSLSELKHREEPEIEDEREDEDSQSAANDEADG